MSPPISGVAAVQIPMSSSAPLLAPRSDQLLGSTGAPSNSFFPEDPHNVLVQPSALLDGSYVVHIPPTASPSTTSPPTSSFPHAPTTTVKDPKTRAPVACHSCRSAKIRCARNRPICVNCTERRAVCTYEDAVKRRGPDKNPGTRVRRPARTVVEKRVGAHPYKDARPKMNVVGPEANTSAPITAVINIDGVVQLPSHDLEAINLPPFSGPLPTLMLQSHAAFPFDLLTVSPQAVTPTGLVGGNYMTTYNDHPVNTILVDDPAAETPIYDQPLHQNTLIQAMSRQTWPGTVALTESQPGECRSESPIQDVIGREPSLRFTQDTWWDTVLSFYDPKSKFQAAQLVTADLQTFFRTSRAWMSFLNVPLFFSMFYHPEQRAMMQPALVLGCLACSVYVQGSEMEGGEAQRRKALQLRDLSQAAFEASYNAGWIDIPLAQASWVIALFEISVHPETTAARMTSSISLMDNIISALGITSIDAENTRSPVRFAGTVPVVGRRGPEGFNEATPLSIRQLSAESDQYAQHHLKPQPPPSNSDQEIVHLSRAPSTSSGCPCKALSMQNEPDQVRFTPLWAMAVKWDPDAHYGVTRRDEARRLVWCALCLVSGDITGRLLTGEPLLDLEMAKPNNYAVLYPAENLYQQDKDIDATYSSKESTWALYSRAMHLWVTCTTHRDAASAPHDKADFATKTWMETIAIEGALGDHHCDGEQATFYQAREYIFDIRMFISHQYRRFIPIPQSDVNFAHLDRKRAMEWLERQNKAALELRAMSMVDHDTFSAALLLRRPYIIWGQMGQIWRALVLFEMDNDLTFAIDVILNILPVFLFMQQMWPCAEQRRRAKPIMDRLRWACQKTGKTLPAFSFSVQSQE